MRYRNCIFDLYGTLVDIHTDETLPQLWEELADYYRKHGADYQPDELQNTYLRIIQKTEAGKTLLRSDAHEAHPEIRIEFVFQTLYRKKGVDAGLEVAVRTGELFRCCSLDYIRLYNGAEKLLRTLRANGQKVWLLSNAQHIFTACELQILGIEPLFDGIYLSSDYGYKKPDRRFFELLLKQHRIEPESAIMVGNDGVCDIQGAQSVGLSTLYIHSNLSPTEAVPEADYMLEEMDLDRVQVILTDK